MQVLIGAQVDRPVRDGRRRQHRLTQRVDRQHFRFGTEFDHGLDVHIGYRRNLSKGMSIELFADIYNVYNRQGTFDVDDVYAPQFSISQNGAGGTEQNANPVSGGTYDDLIWVKVIDRDGVESAAPIGRNPNFHNTTSRYPPAYGRLGLRLSF